MWGRGSWHLYPLSAFWKEEQSFSSTVGVCSTISQTMSPPQRQGKCSNTHRSVRSGAKQAAQLGASSSFIEANWDTPFFFPLCTWGFFKTHSCTFFQGHQCWTLSASSFLHFCEFIELHEQLQLFHGGGMCQRLATKQKQEGLLSPDSEFVQASTTALLHCEAPKGIF